MIIHTIGSHEIPTASPRTSSMKSISVFRENFKINKIPLLLCMTAEYFCNFCTKNAPFPIGETRNSCTPQPFSENDEVGCSITLLFSLDSKNKLKCPSAFCSSFCFLSYYLQIILFSHRLRVKSLSMA